MGSVNTVQSVVLTTATIPNQKRKPVHNRLPHIYNLRMLSSELPFRINS
ncbi:hypothetical protein PAGL106935_13575 [Paenibacillus glucanolyticus]|jgi:hypothetical protein